MALTPADVPRFSIRRKGAILAGILVCDNSLNRKIGEPGDPTQSAAVSSESPPEG
jgi:hypothetical protein